MIFLYSKSLSSDGTETGWAGFSLISDPLVKVSSGRFFVNLSSSFAIHTHFAALALDAPVLALATDLLPLLFGILEADPADPLDAADPLDPAEFWLPLEAELLLLEFLLLEAGTFSLLLTLFCPVEKSRFLGCSGTFSSSSGIY